MINIDDLTYGQLKEIASVFKAHYMFNKGENKNEFATNCSSPFKIGKYYLIRTVTMIQTGKLVVVTPTELVLEEAAWIADTGRFADALKSLNFNEVEPFPDGQVIVSRGALIDACEIKSSPREQK